MIGEEPATPVSLNVAGVLDAGDDVLFTATEQDPAELHVYTGGPNGTVRVTREPGLHTRPGAGTSWSRHPGRSAGSALGCGSGGAASRRARSSRSPRPRC